MNYVLTIGEKEVPQIVYASVGLSLEQYGIRQAENIPGYPALTATEEANFAVGDVTPQIVQETPCGQAFQLASPTGGQVPESPYVPLLPVLAMGPAGVGFLVYRTRRQRARAAQI